MRSKILWLFLSVVICLTSCKKDNASASDQLEVIKKGIIGTWLPTDGVLVVYNPAGKAEQSIKQAVHADDTFEFIDSNQAKRFLHTENFIYTISEVNGNVNLALDGRIYQVSISNNIMTWVFTEDVSSQPGYKMIVTLHLKRLN